MFKKAERKKAKLRLALCGPSGSGKSYSALLTAFGLGGKIAVIDTERGSSELYSELGAYDVGILEPPFSPLKYIEAIKAAENLGYDVIIIDSLSHAWAGEGGLLDIHGSVTNRVKNSFSAWREVTPMHNQLVDTLLQSSCHIIATLRAKTDYLVDEGGKKIQKVGLAPIQRDGLEYEFTVFGDIATSHCITITKDRTGQFQDKAFIITSQFGVDMRRWLNSGAAIPELMPVRSTTINTHPVYRLIKAEKRTLDDGRTFTLTVLENQNGQLTNAWAAGENVTIADLPNGSVIEVDLEQKENSWIINGYSVVHEASVA